MKIDDFIANELNLSWRSIGDYSKHTYTFHENLLALQENHVLCTS